MGRPVLISSRLTRAKYFWSLTQGLFLVTAHHWSEWDGEKRCDSIFCVEFTCGQWAMSWWKGMDIFCLTRKCPIVFFPLDSMPLFTFAGAKIISFSLSCCMLTGPLTAKTFSPVPVWHSTPILPHKLHWFCLNILGEVETDWNISQSMTQGRMATPPRFASLFNGASPSL